ncbi:fructoselysine 6-kinase [Ectobacillus ponti]|uniref:Fructoselysine 6-kinase n=1 Tax=Ectobacillus ponti TaxID=2961894 RepID=A0AA41XAQ4_9BACI|nr:fructoselysine 6-kinase [Ectobacillus ponti]MCP8970025.1 fructoselysine 6-kinase [Ectobacillus ponti]
MKVIGVGDNVVDKYMHKGMMYPGGNALNFSVYAKQLGVEAAYLGTFGNDRAASHIMETLEEIGVDLSHCRQHEGPNAYAGVDLVEGDRVFIGGNSGVQKEHPLVLTEEDLGYIRTFAMAHTSVYSRIESELPKLKETGILLSYDFSADYHEDMLKQVCPYVDVSLLSCGHLSEEETKTLLLQVCSFGSRLAIGTMGSKGAMVYDGQEFYQQAPHFVKPVDTLGAGDSFFTAFILQYLQGKELPDSLEAGAKFAAETCLVDGAFGYGISF